MLNEVIEEGFIPSLFSPYCRRAQRRMRTESSKKNYGYNIY